MGKRTVLNTAHEIDLHGNVKTVIELVSYGGGDWRQEVTYRAPGTVQTLYPTKKRKK